MNTDYAKKKLAEYESGSLRKDFEFSGFSGRNAQAYAAGCFYALTRLLVEELDRLKLERET